MTVAVDEGDGERLPPTTFRDATSAYWFRRSHFPVIDDIGLTFETEPTMYASVRHVGEPRQVQLVRNRYGLRRAVTVFGQNEIRLTTTRIVALERIGSI